jgi:hypothetical protein
MLITAFMQEILLLGLRFFRRIGAVMVMHYISIWVCAVVIGGARIANLLVSKHLNI